MLKLLRRYGLPMLPLFLIAVVLLVGRATAELTLPGLMSDIVDYGISEGGVDSTVPRKLTPDTFNDILENLPQTLQAEFAAGYGFVAGHDYYALTADDISMYLERELAIQLAWLQTGGDMNFDDDNNAISHNAKAFIRAEYERMGMDMEALQMDYVFSTGGMMLIVTFLAIAAAASQGYISARMATGLARKLREDIFDKVVSFTNTEYNNFSTASLITRCTNDVNQVQQLMTMAIRIVVFSPIMGIGGVLMVVGTDPSMAWIIALTVGSMLAFITLFIIIATPRFKIMQKLIDKVNLVTREALTGIMVIRAFVTQKHEAKRFDGANKDLRNTALFLARLGAFQMPIITLISSFTTVLIIWIGANSIDAGSLSVGEMMAFVQYTMFIVWSFLMLAMIVIMLPRAQVAATRIMEILETENVVIDHENPEKLGQNRGDIEFRNVSFKFPGAEGYALSDISFTAQDGKVTAFVGSTGSGKTALVNLVPRFYDVTDGEVLVNGVNVKNASQSDLRGLVGYVPQKAVLFSGTIESNIKYAGEHIDNDAMEKASRIAQAAEFIEERAEGYADEIAQGGTNVSGGQRQRLSIARAIAKKPKIYIFDDSFSALDFKTDAQLRAALAEEIGATTMLIVAQRINTIKNADQIIVLDQGKIVGKGIHKDLLKNCDVYKQIASSQLSEEELAKDLGEGGMMA
ncbi:MAG: ABC transporter ATP-binding protein/permease [Defluviitaleaceae bacterium]|nr:ABC transporter ATP-binding protein/permease [Defluviitaleaceae bacterium]